MAPETQSESDGGRAALGSAELGGCRTASGSGTRRAPSHIRKAARSFAPACERAVPSSEVGAGRTERSSGDRSGGQWSFHAIACLGDVGGSSTGAEEI